MDAKEPEATDSRYCSPIYVDRGVLSNLQLPVVQYELLSLADIEMEVVVMAPETGPSTLLIVVGDQPNDCGVLSKLDYCI